jgi:hypothetical protein
MQRFECRSASLNNPGLHCQTGVGARNGVVRVNGPDGKATYSEDFK